jgi:TRAP-type C4-dicarboxylate transport system permease small subunit
MLNEIALRNIFNNSFRGMTEIAGLFFMWMAFLGIAVLYDQNRLIALDMIYTRLRGPVKTVVWYLHTLVGLCLGLIMLVSFAGLFPFVTTERFSSMPEISKVWQYFPLCFAGGFISLKAAYSLAEKILGKAGRA